MKKDIPYRAGRALRRIIVSGKVDTQSLLADITTDYVCLPAQLAPKAGDTIAKVTMGHSGKAAEALYWGSDEWDKVPYTMEVWGSVTLECTQTEEAIVEAQNLAADLAWEGVEVHMRAKLPLLEKVIVGIYPDLFPPNKQLKRKQG